MSNLSKTTCLVFIFTELLVLQKQSLAHLIYGKVISGYFFRDINASRKTRKTAQKSEVQRFPMLRILKHL